MVYKVLQHRNLTATAHIRHGGHKEPAAQQERLAHCKKDEQLQESHHHLPTNAPKDLPLVQYFLVQVVLEFEYSPVLT